VAHLRERVKWVRGLRAELQDALEPTALSVDGRTFTVEAPLRGERLPIGGYVHIEAGEQTLFRSWSVELPSGRAQSLRWRSAATSLASAPLRVGHTRLSR
jgi:hypothetical protein